MTDLSPAARAVLDAFVGDPTERDELEDDRRYLAAALRAAANAIEPVDITQDHEWLLEQLLAIADELESQ